MASQLSTSLRMSALNAWTSAYWRAKTPGGAATASSVMEARESAATTAASVAAVAA